MYYDYYSQKNEFLYEEYISSGVYTINPTLSSLQEVILLYIKELSFYLLKLKNVGISNQNIKENLITILSGVVTNSDYNQDQFQHIVKAVSEYLNQAKTIYSKYCKENELQPHFLKTYFKHSVNFSLADAIKKGEKYFFKKSSLYSQEQKDMFDIMLFLAKSMCIRIIQLKSFDKDYEFAYIAMLELFSAMNFHDLKLDDAKKQIYDFMENYHKILVELNAAQEEKYGPRDTADVSFTPRPGKAILFSGIDLVELEAVLKAAEPKNIDVYTHGLEVLMAHTLEKFKKYKNLAGHYGKGIDNCLIDYATFPGAILTTRHFFQKLEYMYRGRLYTTDFVASHGVVKIHDNNFTQLINSAQEAKGFVKKIPLCHMTVGFSQKEIDKKLDDIFAGFDAGKYKHFIIVGIVNYIQEHRAYFDKFFKMVPKDCFVLSLSYEVEAENMFHVDAYFDYLLIYKLLRRIEEKKQLNKMDVSVFMTKCDQHTIANILTFSKMGVKNIFLCKCPPTLVSPKLMETLHKTFGIKEYSEPKNDLDNIIIQEEG